MSKARVFASVAIALTISACAQPTTMRPEVVPDSVKQERLKQLKAVAELKFGRQVRLHKVNQRVAVAGAEFCGEKVYRTSGVVLASYAWIGEEEAELMKSVYPKFDRRPRVWFTVPGSPGELAGLKEGDEIVSINGMEVYSKAERDMVAAKLREKNGDAEHVYVVNAPGGKREVRAKSELACDYPAKIKDSAVVNAYADGKNVYVTTGMMDFVKNDDELAGVMGHENAHDFRGHIEAKRQNELGGRIAGAVLDGLFAVLTGTLPGNSGQSLGSALASQAYSQDFEAEADYVGLYVMKRAGFDVSVMPDFWARMGAASPQAVTMASSHPTTPERSVALRAAIAEIEEKIRKGESLAPNEKKGGEAAGKQ